MEDNQKTRLLILALAGVLLIGGGSWWVISQNNAADKAEGDANASQTLTDGQGTAAPSPETTAQTPPLATTAQTPPPATTAQTPPPATTAQTPPPATTAQTPPPATTTQTPAPVKSGLQNLAGAAPDMDEPLPVNTSPAPANTLIAAATPPGISAPVQQAAAARKYAATRRDEAISAAKQVAGREDPMMGTFQKDPYPSPWTKIASEGGRTTADDAAEEAEKANKERKSKGESLVPPPPPPRSEKPIPPPPPSGLGGGTGVAEAPSLPIDILPQPPDKPLVTPSLRLTAIVGDRAVLQVPMSLRMQNHWPAVICLAKNERFEDPNHGSFSVVSVDRDSVTIEEEQERSVKTLPQIK